MDRSDVKAKINKSKKLSGLQILAAICMLTAAIVSFVHGDYDVVFWQLVLSVYCILFYRCDKQNWCLCETLVDFFDNYDFLIDYNKLLKAKVDFLEDKITQEEFSKKAFEFNMVHHVVSEEELKHYADAITEETTGKENEKTK